MTDTLMLERIHAGFSRLRLPRIPESLETILRSSEETSKSYLCFLDELHHSVVIHIRGNSYRLRDRIGNNVAGIKES